MRLTGRRASGIPSVQVRIIRKKIEQGAGGGGWRAHTPLRRTALRLPFPASLLALAAIALLLRLLALPPALPELDAANFARALTRFDLAAQSPHAPGYPLYVLATRLFAALGADDLPALVLPGALLGALSVLALGLALAARVGRSGALLAAAIVALAPLAVLTGGAPTSDGAGFAMLTLAAAALLSLRTSSGLAGALGAGLVLGLVLGVRPSFAPIVLPLVVLAPTGLRLATAASLAATGLALLAGLATVVGPAALLGLLQTFLVGHATEWGGTVLVAPSLPTRAAQLAGGLITAGLGLPGPQSFTAARLALAIALTALVVGGLLARPWRATQRARLLLGIALPALAYAAFAFALQNVEKARHALPLLLPIAIALGALVPARVARGATPGQALLDRTPVVAGRLPLPGPGAPARRAAFVVAARRLLPAIVPSVRRQLPALVALALLATTLPLAHAQGTRPSPAARFVAYVRAELPAEGAQYFTGDEGRLLTTQAPWYRAGRPKAAELPEHAARLAAAGVKVFVTSASPGVDALRGRLEPVADFREEPLLRTHGHTITLYRLRSDALAAAGLPR